MSSLNKTVRFVLLVLTASIASLVHAGNDGAIKSPKQADTRSQLDSAAQGNPSSFSSIDKLPPHYSGSDCFAIVRKLKSFNVAKSEFETSASYSDRMNALGSRKLDGARTFAEPLAFVASDSMIESMYVADEGFLDVTAKWGDTSQTIAGRRYPGSIVSERSAGVNSVTLSNAFGATVRGTESRRTVCTLVFANNRSFDEDRDAISALIPMTPAEAKAAKQQLALLYVGTIASPYLGTYVASHTATLDDPHKVTWNGDSLVVNLSEVWLFNRATGKVYKKVPVASTETATASAGPAAKVTSQAIPSVPAPTKHGGTVDVNNCKPAYPAISKRLEETGTVTLSFWVSPAGQVVESRLVRSTGFRNLDIAAREALSKCTFHAALENGVPVDTWVDVKYSFDLND